MTVSQAPGWFNDINYKFVEHLGLRGWYYQLIERQRIELDKILLPDTTSKELWERYLNRIQELTRNPDPPANQLRPLPALYEIPAHKSLRDLHTGDAGDYEGSNYDRSLYVNLNAPDAELKRQFAKWVKAAREAAPNRGFKQGVSETNLKNWRDYKLLELHDLLVFKEFTGHIKSVEEMFDWLYTGIHVEEQKDYMFDRVGNLEKAKRIIFAMSFQSVVAKN